MLTIDKANEQVRMETSFEELVALEKKAIYCDNCERVFIPKRPDIKNCGFCTKKSL